MPRMARIVLAHYPHHIVQRGHNRQATFAEAADFKENPGQNYLSALARAG